MRAALAAIAVLAASPAAAQAPGPGLASAVVRATFVVSDIERSKRFYAYAFGYTVKFDGLIGNAENRVLLALPRDRSARFVILDGERTILGKPHEAVGIGLLAFPGQVKPRLAQPRGNRFAGGQAMLAIVTSDIATVIARLRELGAPILAGPVIGHGGRETEIVTSDPDGTRLHVVEQRPG